MTWLGAVSWCLSAMFLCVCVSTVQITKQILNVHPRPFRVLWNYPDQSCQVRNIDLDLSRYGIVTNIPRTFVGNEVATLYSSKVGLWPSFQDNNPTKPINGGIPQLANLTAHLEKLRKDIASQIPESSTGYAVLDQEVWRALYDLNFGVYRVYKRASVTEASNKHRADKNKQQRRSAQEEWNNSAREFMESSLLEARAVRPDVHWGYYLHPQTWGTADQTRTVNDRMSWLFQASTGIYPSIYLNDVGIPPSEMKQRVESTLSEAIRVRGIYGQADTPIIAYTIVQNNDFFSKEVLDYAIGLHAEIGIDGVIVWGSSTHFKPNPTEKCSDIRNYVRDVLGPYVAQLTDKFTNCSISKCGGRGRCVRKDYAQSTADILLKSAHRRHARPASAQEEIDAILKHDGLQLRDSPSHGNIRKFSSRSIGNHISTQNRTRGEVSLVEKSLADNKNTRTNHALYMFKTALLRAQTRQNNQPVNIEKQTSNTEDMSQSENNTHVHQSSIIKVEEAVRELVQRGFQSSQNTVKALPHSPTNSINTIVSSSLSVNKTNTVVINSQRKGLSVEYTGHTLHDKLVDIYNYVANLTHKQNNTFSVRFDQAKNQNLTATQMSSNNSLLHNQGSVDGPTMSKTTFTTASGKLPSSRRVHTSDRSVQVNTANHESGLRTEDNKGSQAHSAQEANIHASDPYDNYVCQCYSQWKGPLCEKNNGF